MDAINISKVLGKIRREKGITQDQLAAYLGVTKASVSKWETGQSYPDILFLPQLAAFFNISIDELIGYEPQMTKADIKKVYLRLSERYATEPFELVTEEWHEIVKKYHACFPLLYQMGQLMLNQLERAEGEARQKELLAETRALFARVKEESHEVELCRMANCSEAICEISLNNPLQVLELLSSANEPPMGEEVILASAHQMIGETEKAKEVIQIGVARHLFGLISDIPNFLMLHMDQPDVFDEMAERLQKLVEAFEVDTLHPGILIGVYGTVISGYAMMGKTEKALDTLEVYTDIVINARYPMTLHGDAFFDRLDNWYSEFDLGASLPVADEKGMKESVVAMIRDNPQLEPLKGIERFEKLVRKLEHRLLDQPE